jgi:hypothetical protein
MTFARRARALLALSSAAQVIILACSVLPAFLTTLVAAVAALQHDGAVAPLLGLREGRASRRWWVAPRAACWWDTDAQNLDDADFRTHFRMCWATFYFVCDVVRDAVERQDTQLRDAIHFEKATAMALWRLATGDSYRSIALHFGTSRSVVCDATHRVAAALAAAAPRFIKLPKTDEEIEFLARMSAAQLRDCVGAPHLVLSVDGSHIGVPMGDHNVGHMDWKNRKGQYSMILQGVVDYSSRFRSVQIGWPGSVHDARVFRNSEFGRAALDGSLFRRRSVQLPDGTVLHYSTVGDAAYPRALCVHKPHIATGNLSDPEQWHDYVVNVQRGSSERAYGRLKGRWRTLHLKAHYKLTDVPTIILACCVLHNICEDHAEEFDSSLLDAEDDSSDSSDDEAEDDMDPVTAQALDQKRAKLAQYLWQHAPQEVKLLGVRQWREKYGRWVRRPPRVAEL